VHNSPSNIVFVSMSLCPDNPATHILSCSTEVAGTSCGPICASGAIWQLPAGVFGGQTAGPFDFVVDQSPACFYASFEDPLLGGRPKPENYTVEKLCFSCAGVDAAVAVLPSTWGSVKAIYR